MLKNNDKFIFVDVSKEVSGKFVIQCNILTIDLL
jgi:hypothetical protein